VHVILSRTPTGSSTRFAASALATYITRSPGPAPGSPARSPSSRMRRSSSDLGEYRAVMSLSRLLPQGWDIKQQVDAAIAACSQVGGPWGAGCGRVGGREVVVGGGWGWEVKCGLPRALLLVALAPAQLAGAQAPLPCRPLPQVPSLPLPLALTHSSPLPPLPTHTHPSRTPHPPGGQHGGGHPQLQAHL
jgi:hypothetical protein